MKTTPIIIQKGFIYVNPELVSSEYNLNLIRKTVFNILKKTFHLKCKHRKLKGSEIEVVMVKNQLAVKYDFDHLTHPTYGVLVKFVDLLKQAFHTSGLDLPEIPVPDRSNEGISYEYGQRSRRGPVNPMKHG